MCTRALLASQWMYGIPLKSELVWRKRTRRAACTWSTGTAQSRLSAGLHDAAQQAVPAGCGAGGRAGAARTRASTALGGAASAPTACPRAPPCICAHACGVQTLHKPYHVAQTRRARRAGAEACAGGGAGGRAPARRVHGHRLLWAGQLRRRRAGLPRCRARSTRRGCSPSARAPLSSRMQDDTPFRAVSPLRHCKPPFPSRVFS